MQLAAAAAATIAPATTTVWFLFSGITCTDKEQKLKEAS